MRASRRQRSVPGAQRTKQPSCELCGWAAAPISGILASWRPARESSTPAEHGNAFGSRIWALAYLGTRLRHGSSTRTPCEHAAAACAASSQSVECNESAVAYRLQLRTAAGHDCELLLKIPHTHRAGRLELRGAQGCAACGSCRCASVPGFLHIIYIIQTAVKYACNVRPPSLSASCFRCRAPATMPNHALAELPPRATSTAHGARCQCERLSCRLHHIGHLCQHSGAHMPHIL